MTPQTINLQILFFFVGWPMNNIYTKYSTLPLTESTGESQVYNLGSVLISFVILSKSLNFSEFQFPYL